MKIIMLKGLPGSGKTTYAKALQIKDPLLVRTNKDELRAMLHNGQHSKKREELVIGLRDEIVRYALRNNQDVVVDDTNFAPIHEETLRKAAATFKADFEVHDMATHYPDNATYLKTCIYNDLKRPKSVGERVIKTMYRDFVAPKVIPFEKAPLLPDVVLCDIDGTLALFPGKNPYDRDFSQDKVNTPIRDILNMATETNTSTILLSGRSEKQRLVTERWLDDNEIPYKELYMRPADDIRNDTLVKLDLFNTHIRGKWNVNFVLDDRDRVVELWRSLGLTCLQVAPGDF